jgi:peptide/nickel transport system substrate-binding protein
MRHQRRRPLRLAVLVCAFALVIAACSGGDGGGGGTAGPATRQGRRHPELRRRPGADAGYTKGADGIYAKDGKKLSLRISTTAGNQLRETPEQLIQAQLKQVGIDIKIVNADNRKFFGEWLPQGNFDIANFGWVGNPFAISSSQDIYRTGGGGNYGQYQSDKVDQLFGQAVREVDEAKSAEIGNQIDQQLTADMAAIALYAKPTYLAVRSNFANVGDNATQEGPFWNSGLWAQKAT